MSLFLFIIAAASGLLGSSPRYLFFVAAAGAVVYVWRAARQFVNKNNNGPALYAIHGGVLFFYALYWLLREYSSVFYLLLADFSVLFSGVIGWIISRPIAMGITYSGLDLFTLFVIASAVACGVDGGVGGGGRVGNRGDRSGAAATAAGATVSSAETASKAASMTALAAAGRTGGAVVAIRRFLIDTGLYLAAWSFYIGFWTVLAENSIGLGLYKVEPLTGPLDYRFLLFALLAAVFSIRHRGLSHEYQATGFMRALFHKPRRGVYILCAQAVAITVCVALLAYNPPAPPALPAPHDSQAPPASGGRVVFWDTGIDFNVPQKGIYGLERVGMFGVLPRYLEERGYACEIVGEVDAARLEGAAALVVINPLISPSMEATAAIADFVRGGGGVLAVGDHTGDEQIRRPLNRLLSPVGIEFNFDSAVPFQSFWPNAFITRKSPIFSGIVDRQLNIVVGASLSCGYRAKPLLIAKSGYSDAGDITNEADGYLGDMVFSRGERVGDLVLMAEARYGRGVYVAVGDTTLFQNTVLAYSAPFVDNIFAHITSGRRAEVAGDAGIDIGSFDGYCLIESYNMPAFSFDKTGNAVDGFIAAVLRTGMLPYLNLNESLADALDGPGRDIKAVVINGPAKPYSNGDISALYRFLDRGGAIILLGHYDSSEATKELAALFGIMFDNLPVGRIAPTANPEMAFWDACPVLIALELDAQPLMTIWGFSIIYRAEVSKGEILVIGDESFIKNKNLENIDEYRMGNIEFVEEALERIKTLYN
ncbi:MAG: hypothetical protein FWH01_06540 [Oscillospiraceae bacterium]|nr:hypothetical protein [Oscillospiraceae bacterium]